METIFYNLQNIIIDLKKLNNTFTINKITNYHYDLAKLYIYHHNEHKKLIDINNIIDKTVEDIKSLEPKNKYFPKIYTEYIEYEKYKDCNILLIVHPINYNDNIHLDNIIFQKEIKIDSKIKYNNLLQQLYPNEGSLIEKTNRYYCENPLKLYILKDLKDLQKNKYFISTNHNITQNILKTLLHSRSLDNTPELSYRMKYKLESIKSPKDDNCFIIINNSLEYINIDDEIESIEMTYYKRKNIIYNPEEHYYYNGYKFIRNNKTVKELIELIELFNNSI